MLRRLLCARRRERLIESVATFCLFSQIKLIKGKKTRSQPFLGQLLVFFSLCYFATRHFRESTDLQLGE